MIRHMLAWLIELRSNTMSMVEFLRVRVYLLRARQLD